MTAVLDARTSRLPIRIENLFAIAELARVGDDFRPLRETGEHICVAVAGMPGVDWATVTLCDPEGSPTDVFAGPGTPSDLTDRSSGTGLSGLWSPMFEAYASGREVVVVNVDDGEGAIDSGASGWVGALHVPIATRGHTLGTLNLYSRAAIDYTAEELELLHAVARAAGCALETALFAERHRSEVADTDARRAELARQHDRLTERLHQGEHELTEVMRAQARLAEVVLESGIDKVDAICTLLAERLHASVMVCDATGKTRAFGGDDTVRARMSAAIARRDAVKLARVRDGGVVSGVSVYRIGHDRVLGLLLVHPEHRDEHPADLVLLRHTTGLLAFELEADRAERAARDIARPAILHALIRGHLSARQSHAVGKYVDAAGQALRIGFMHTGDDVAATAVSHRLNFVSRGRWCLAAAAELDGVLLLVEDREEPSMRSSLAALLDTVAPGDWAVGLSERFRDLEQAPAALEQARVALAVAPHRQVTMHEELGATASLLRHVPPGAAARYVEDVLRPLIDYDRQRKGALIKTVTAYLNHRGSLRQAALELGVHENTVQLRLARASQLLGSDLHDAQWLGLLAVALSWYRLLGER